MATSYKVLLGTSSARDAPSTDISGDLAQAAGASFLNCSRGYDRATLGAQPRAGHMTMRIENIGLSYSLLSPRPGRGVRVQKVIDADTYNLWQGIADIPMHTMIPFKPVIQTSGMGNFTRLAQKVISTELYEDVTTGEAIGHVLDAAGFPAALRDIDTGVVTLPQWWCEGDDAMEMLRRLQQTEGITAQLFESGDGKIVFRDRNSRFDDTNSNTIQETFNSNVGEAEPWLTGFQFTPEYREIVNYAEHERIVLSADSSPSVVWTDPEGLYIIPANDTLIIDATADSGFPFKDAITPVEGTDYSVGIGSVASVTLSRTSGVSTRITFTAGDDGATVGGVSGGDIQLRATAFEQVGSFVEKSTIDASDSIDEYDLKPWTGSMWPTMPWDEMRNNLNAVVSWKKDPHGRVTFGVLANRGTEADGATARLDIGDRIRVIETDLGLDAECWIERIEHDISAPARHMVTFECSVIDAEFNLPVEDTEGEEPEVPAPEGDPTYGNLIDDSLEVQAYKFNTRLQVQLNHDISYVFYHDFGLEFGYQKSVDAAETWPGSAIAIGDDNSFSWDIYYEPWHDEDNDRIVHAVWDADLGGSGTGIRYRQLNLETDTLGTIRKVTEPANFAQGSLFGVCVARDGSIYVTGKGTLTGALMFRSQDGGETWSAVTSLIENDQTDRSVLWPDFAGAEADILAIYWDNSASELSVKRYSASGNSVTETLIAGSMDTPASAPLNFTTTIDADGAIKVVAFDVTPGASTSTAKAWTVSGSTVTARTDVVAATYCSTPGLTINRHTGQIWCFYARDPNGAALDDQVLYYKTSTDDMVTWGSEVVYNDQYHANLDQIGFWALDPVPSEAVNPAYYHIIESDLRIDYPPQIRFAPVGGGGSQEDNPFDEDDAGENVPGTTGLDDQGLLMRWMGDEGAGVAGTTGSLVMSDGPVGAAEDIDLTQPANSLTVTASTPVATVRSALEAGNYRILVDDGVTLNFGSTAVDVAGRVQFGCLNGTVTINGASRTGGAIFTTDDTEIFIFNINVLQSEGTDGANNPGGWFEITEGADLIYAYHVNIRHSDDQVGFTDAPEGWNIWNNSTASTKRITLHGCSSTNNVQPSKFAVVGAGAPGAADTIVTMFECVPRAWSRDPFMDDSSQLDFVNCVLPTGLNRGGGSGASVQNGAKMDIRGCSIEESNEFTFGELIDNTASDSSYYPLLGAGTDNNREVGDPVIDGVPTNGASVLTKSYTLTASVMDGAKRTQIVNRAGPGKVAVTVA